MCKSTTEKEGTPPGSALIFGSRSCGFASRFTPLARGRGLESRRALFSRQCALLAGCECSLRFGLHGLPFFLNGPKITPPSKSGGGGQRKAELCLTSFIKLAHPGYMERSRSKCATHSRRLVKLYLARLPFYRGKLHLAQETQHERQARCGADIYAQCRMQLSTNRQAAAAQDDAAGARAGAAITAASAKLLQPPPAPTTCRSVMVGNVLTTNCN
jgi:hypothetical protein